MARPGLVTNPKGVIVGNHIEIIEAQALVSEQQIRAQVRLKSSIVDRLMSAARMLQDSPDSDARAALWITGETLVDAMRGIWRVAR